MPNRFDPPSDLQPNHAFGELVVRNERGAILHAVPARVNLATGALHPDQEISRTSYDWCCDTFAFRLAARGDSVEVEEGCEVDPQLDFCVSSDLEQLQDAWRIKAPRTWTNGCPKAADVPRVLVCDVKPGMLSFIQLEQVFPGDAASPASKVRS